MISINGQNIEPTIFPDKTSQVWKLSEQLLSEIEVGPEVEVKWDFEHEGELIHVCQLAQLIMGIDASLELVLYCPYLPYGRQDKEVSNESTFALETFIAVVSTFYDELKSFDIHNYWANCLKTLDITVTNIDPTEVIEKTIEQSGSTFLCYPDRGAKDRYDLDFGKNPKGDFPKWCSLAKVRNQLTGEITGLTVDGGYSFKDETVLIVDDLCDGGRTFIESAKLLLAKGARDVKLYVSHGIFSKGTQVIHDSGISEIYTKDGLYSVAQNKEYNLV